jgi:Fic family protein
MPDWKEDRSARERVRTIAETVTDPVSVNWVKDQADVGWQTAKDELEELADRGVLHRITSDGNVRYVPDFTRQYTERIRKLALEYSRAELREELVRTKEDVEAIESEYGVDSREELEHSLADEECSVAETRDRQQALRRWEELADELQILEHALNLFEDLHDVDPYVAVQGNDDDGDARSVDTGTA